MSIRANVDAGRLTERVTVERRTITQDATTGDAELTWSTLVVCWASVDGVLAREAISSDAMQSAQDYTVWIRADVIDRYAITQVDRISWRGKVLEIQGIPDQQQRGRLISVLCRAGGSDG